MSRSMKFYLLLVDLLLLLTCFAIGQSLRLAEFGGFNMNAVSGWWQIEGRHRLVALGIAGLVGLLRFAFSQFHYSRRRPFWDELREMLATITIMAIVDATALFMTHWQFSRAAYVATWSLAFLVIPLGRAGWKLFLLRKGWWQQPMVLVGSGENAREAWLALGSEKLLGYYLLEIVTEKEEQVSWSSAPARMWHPGLVAGWPRDVQIVVAMEAPQSDWQERVIRSLSSACAEFLVIPPVRGLPMHGLQTFHPFSHEVLVLQASNSLAQLPSRVLKRSFDIVGSLFLLIVLAPVLLLLTWKVSRTGGRPVFFAHERIGHKGSPFLCPKYRSMVVNAQAVLADLLEKSPEAREEWNREFKLRNDPRITAVGHFLRRTSLDELPQLWSVLKGEMSLVGPRPIVQAELERYGDNAAYYLQVRPGMTGLWQVSGRNDIDYDTRVALDVWYVRNWSLWNDVVILLKTFGVVLKRDGAY